MTVDLCGVAGCGAPAAVSMRFAGETTPRRYCTACAERARQKVMQPKLIEPDWYTRDDLGPQAADAGAVRAIRCRACRLRHELRPGEATPARCWGCGKGSADL